MPLSNVRHFAKKKILLYLLIQEMLSETIILVCVILYYLNQTNIRVRRRPKVVHPYRMIPRIQDQVTHLNRLVRISDSDCLHNLRMDRNAFAKLCCLLRELGGLNESKYMGVEEQVAMFLTVVAHHKKNMIIKFDFIRSGQTVLHYIHLVLKAILKLHSILLVNPTPIPDDETNPRWMWFKGCLGALDGMYINVHVRTGDQGRYRTRNGQISTNVLAVCDRNLKFIYVLPGWEGSAADCRVLRDAVTRPYGLKVPKGNYYLCDDGYANSEGFLIPYRGCRYHVDEWGPGSSRPTNYQEHFNMRHTRARNLVERAFGIMDMRWSIFRSATYYPIKTQIRLIMCCFLLHNFIRNEMHIDPIEQMLDQLAPNVGVDHDHDEFVDAAESSPQWNAWRDELAWSMFHEWNNRVM